MHSINPAMDPQALSNMFALRSLLSAESAATLYDDQFSNRASGLSDWNNLAALPRIPRPQDATPQNSHDFHCDVRLLKSPTYRGNLIDNGMPCQQESSIDCQMLRQGLNSTLCADNKIWYYALAVPFSRKNSTFPVKTESASTPMTSALLHANTCSFLS